MVNLAEFQFQVFAAKVQKKYIYLNTLYCVDLDLQWTIMSDAK